MSFTIFVLYADIPWRRQVMSLQAKSPDDYLFYGMPDLNNSQYCFSHNLERPPKGRIAAHSTRLINASWHLLGGYGGDWATTLRNLTAINRSHLALSTQDSVGIPLVMLEQIGFISVPIVYVSIGLPERLAQLRNNMMCRLYYRAFRKISRIICYGFEEAEQLRSWLNLGEDRIKFIPFGVDTENFAPIPTKTSTIDVLSIGADPNRDFALLVQFARTHPEFSVRIITRANRARAMDDLPANVELLLDVSLATLREFMAEARVIVLPLKENSYSGATTTLLQAMSMARPVVVSRVGAIRRGYNLEDGVNCRLVTPGDLADLEQAICAVLSDSEQAQNLGTAARKLTIERLSWKNYVENFVRVFDEIRSTQLVPNE